MSLIQAIDDLLVFVDAHKEICGEDYSHVLRLDAQVYIEARKANLLGALPERDETGDGVRGRSNLPVIALPDGVIPRTTRWKVDMLTLRTLADSEKDSDAFVPIGKLWREHFGTYRKVQGFLKQHLEIRTRKPAKNRLEVHAADWIKHWTGQPSEPTDAQIEEYLEGLEQRTLEQRLKQPKRMGRQGK